MILWIVVKVFVDTLYYKLIFFNRYVTLQRGPARTTTVAPSVGGDDQEVKVGQNFSHKFRENFYANRIRREAGDEPVAVIFPASESSGNILAVQSVLPDLPQENGIAYIYPDNLNARENRQTSPETTTTTSTTLETTTTTLTSTTTATTATTSTTTAAPTTTTGAGLKDLNERKDAENELAVNEEISSTAEQSTEKVFERNVDNDDGAADAGDEQHRDVSSGEEGEIISVSVSRSMSEAFSIPEAVTGIIDFITTTFAPPATVFPETATEEVKVETTTAGTTTTTTTLASKSDKGRTSIFSSKRAHPILASKAAAATSESASASSTTTTTSTPITRKSFFRQKTITDLNESSKKTNNETAEPTLEASKPKERFNILNRDSRPRFNPLTKKSNESEAATQPPASDVEEVSTEESPKPDEVPVEVEAVEAKEEEAKDEEVEHSTEPVEPATVDEDKNEVEDHESKPDTEAKVPSAILISQKLRPKFEVPKSLQGKLLLEQAVVEKKAQPVERKEESEPTTARSPVSVESKLKSPLRQRQSSRFSAPATTTSKPVVIKSLAPRSRNRVRPDKPVDLSTSPSQTVTRTRPSAPSRPRVVETTQETATTAPRAPAGPTTTEKLTVADVLATLHGEPEPETKTSTLRPHSFKPKHGSASRDKLREKIREHFTAEDHADAVAAGEIPDDEFEPVEPTRKESRTTTEKPAVKPTTSAPELQPTQASGHVRRVSRPRNGSQQQVKPRPVEEEQPRSSGGVDLQPPIITAPRRRQRPQQNGGGKVRQEAERTAPPPTGGRLLSDADLMTGLGFGKKEPETEFVPTPVAPLAADEELEGELHLDEDQDEEAPAEVKVDETPAHEDAGPFSLTIEDILKSAIVETNVPIAPEVLEATSILPPAEAQPTVALPVPEESFVPLPKPEKVASAAPSRGRTHVPTRHRLDSSTQPPAQPSRQSAPIESKRVRTRQRITTTQAPEQLNVDQPLPDDSTQTQRAEEHSGQTSRQPTRVRQPIRNQTTRVAAEFPASSGRTRTGNQPTRQPNKVNNNRLRVRGGSRSTTTELPAPESKLEDDAFTLSATEANADIFVPDYDIGANVLGKFDDFDEEGGESTNTDQQVDGEDNNDDDDVSAEDAEDVLNAVSADLAADNKEEVQAGVEVEEETPARKFSPRFGEKQRKSVRSKLKQHLFEPTPASTDHPLSVGGEEEPDFESVSPSDGLSSLPAAFFTTTSRFESFSSIGQDQDLESFLPTQKPPTRIGRSTVGYGGNVVDVTEKPFVKLGISEHSLIDVTSTTTTESSEAVATTATITTLAAEAALNEIEVSTPGEKVTADGDEATTATTEAPVAPKRPFEVGSRLGQKKKADFLSKLSEKILTDREEKEK